MVLQTRLSSATLKKIHKSRKSKSKTHRNKTHISKSLKASPRDYYYSQTTSYTKSIENGKMSEQGMEVIDSSNSKTLTIRKLKNGVMSESQIPK